jgi:hypothetical protein
MALIVSPHEIQHRLCVWGQLLQRALGLVGSHRARRHGCGLDGGWRDDVEYGRPACCQNLIDCLDVEVKEHDPYERTAGCWRMIERDGD